MASLSPVLQSGHDSWRETAKPDRLTHIRARGTEAVEDELLYVTGRTLLPHTHTIMHTEA